MPKNKPQKGPKAQARDRARARARQEQGAVADYRQRMLAALAQLLSGDARSDYMKDMMGMARGLYPPMGGGFQSPGQMRRMARADMASVINPQLAGIRKLYGQRSDDIGQAYGTYFSQFADRMGGYADAMETTQSKAVADQQTADQALASFLGGRGMELAGDVAAQMRGISAPQGTLDATAGSLAGLASGSAGQTYALGGAALDQMRAEAQSMNTWARKQPMRAQQLGMERMGAEQRMLTRQMQEELDALQAQAPELALQLFSQYQDRNQANRGLAAQRSAALLGFLGDASTQEFNRLTAGSAILRDLLSGAQGLEGTYAGLDADLSIPAPSSGGGAGTTVADNAAARQQILENIGSLPIFQPKPIFNKIGEQVGTGPMPAKKQPYKAYQAVVAAIRYLMPDMQEQQAKRAAVSILQQLGVPIRTKPWKPRPKPGFKPLPDYRPRPGGRNAPGSLET